MKRLLISGCVVIASALAQVPSTKEAVSPAEREAHWRQDLQALSAGLKAPGIKIAGGIATRGQKDFADLYPNFDAEVASIEEAIPNLSDAELYLRLLHLIASAHIAHNTIDIPLGMGFLIRLPLDFHWFADGLAVSAATADYQELLGARVLSIGGRTPEQFLTDLSPYTGHSNSRDDRFACDALVLRYRSQYRIEGAHPEKGMIRNRNPLMRRLFCFRDNVAAGLMHPPTLPLPAERRGQTLA